MSDLDPIDEDINFDESEVNGSWFFKQPDKVWFHCELHFENRNEIRAFMEEYFNMKRCTCEEDIASFISVFRRNKEAAGKSPNYILTQINATIIVKPINN